MMQELSLFMNSLKTIHKTLQKHGSGLSVYHGTPEDYIRKTYK